MRSARIVTALIVACSGGEQRPAESPDRGTPAESDGFDRKQQEELSELLGVDGRAEPEGDAGGGAPP